MKSQKNFLMLAMLMALVISTLLATHAQEEFLAEDDDDAEAETSNLSFAESDQVSSLRGTSRLLAQRMTCDKYPRVCRAKGSPGPDCCKKKCVNVMTDRLNCGKCGKKCKYSEICCKGVCVNPSSNKKHCGSCNNGCQKGTSCLYGLCSYA